MNLYELSLEGLQIQDILQANDGELSPELEARMDALLVEGPERIEAAAMVVRGLEASAGACKAESERLRARAEGFQNQADHLKARITFALDAAFNGKVKTPRFTIWAQSSIPRKNISLDPSYSIDQLREFDPDLVKVTLELNKEKIWNYYKNDALANSAIRITEQPGTRYVRIK